MPKKCQCKGNWHVRQMLQWLQDAVRFLFCWICCVEIFREARYLGGSTDGPVHFNDTVRWASIKNLKIAANYNEHIRKLYRKVSRKTQFLLLHYHYTLSLMHIHKRQPNFAHWILKMPTANSFCAVKAPALSQPWAHNGMQLTTNGSLAAHLSPSLKRPRTQSSVACLLANAIVCPRIKLPKRPRASLSEPGWRAETKPL